MSRIELESFIVNAEQMGRIEQRMFDAGFPVAALMEKVGGRIAQRLVALYLRSPNQSNTRSEPALGVSVGVLVGPGHNGGDALVVARELFLQGCRVQLLCPFEQLKPLTASHFKYVNSLGIETVPAVEHLAHCDVIVDGLFGFGLTRPLEGAIADLINRLNQRLGPVVSIDLPSGLHSDTGQPLGTAVKADQTLCLGLWKRAFVQTAALDYIGCCERIDFDIPLADIYAVLGQPPQVQRITSEAVRSRLPLPRPSATHKYKVGSLLLVCGSKPFAGAALLSGLGARASGVGMLTVAVPEALRLWLVGQLPEALVVGCPETETGAIAQLPEDLMLEAYDAIACGPGLTRAAQPVVRQLLDIPRPLLLDADGLNSLADLGTLENLRSRPAATVLTPHFGEFKRLFPAIAEAHISETRADAGTMAQKAAQTSGAIVLLKGARTAIAAPDQSLWFNPESTPALARGGSGDVLTGLIGGLMAQVTHTQIPDTQIPDTQVTSAQVTNRDYLSPALVASWWHAQTALQLERDRSGLGVDPQTLAQTLTAVLAQNLAVFYPPGPPV
ncbi:MAG: NAD(P)H-hydrate dehydratase [Cyanobacteria bacterium P01_H01_bin.119]